MKQTSIYSRTFETVLLLVVAGLSIFYCFDFGLILTAYPHGGQLVGVPFVILLLGYTSFILYSRSLKTRQTFRIIYYSYVASMVLYLFTLRCIHYWKGKTAWEYLHSFQPPDFSLNDVLFLAFAGSGVFVCLALLVLKKWKVES